MPETPSLRLPLPPGLRRASLFLGACVLCGLFPAPAQAAAPVAKPSVIGMGMNTGTPMGDIRAAVEPRLISLPIPRTVEAVRIPESLLRTVPALDGMSFSRPMRIGVEARLGDSIYASWIQYTLEQLKFSFGAENVQIFFLDERGIGLAVENRQIDFFLGDAHTFALQQSRTNVEQIATFLPVDASRAEDAQGGVIFTRKYPIGVNLYGQVGRRVAASLESLRSASVVATTEGQLGGWLATLRELEHYGIHEAQLLKQTTFLGDPGIVIECVMAGSYQIGILPACALERFQMEGKIRIDEDITLISPKPSGSLRCVLSSATYPGWAFAALGSTNGQWKKTVGAVLFAMSGERYGGQWQLPALNRSVFDLFYELKIGPYEHLASWSLNRFMREHAESLALFLFVAFLVIFYSVSISVLMHRKKRELREALHERDLVEAAVAQSRQHIANLERTGIVGQMSTIIAHELKQPLSAIMNYANALNRRTAAGRFDQESFRLALTEIRNEAERASEIVNRVRAYAKHDYPPRKVTDLSVVIGNSITTFRRSRQTNAAIILRVSEGSMAEVDAWEIELAVLNLLKNAADAISGVPLPKIEVSLVPQDATHWALSVADNGPYLTDEQLAGFFKPLQTTKGAKGMGLGLSIVANIAERHAGRITVERNAGTGVRFTMIFPRVPKPNETLAEMMLPPRMQVLGGPAPVPEAGTAAEEEKGAALKSVHAPATVHSAGFSDILTRMERGSDMKPKA